MKHVKEFTKVRSKIATLNIPIEFGSNQPGTRHGPAALFAAGLHATLSTLNYDIIDLGTANHFMKKIEVRSDAPVRHLKQYALWTRALADQAYDMAASDRICVFLGGDHCLSAGTVAGLSRHAVEAGRAFFVLWLDAHPDLHTFETSQTGNAHGTPAAFFCGLPGFDTLLGGPLETPVDPKHLLMLGLRSVDPAERAHMLELGIGFHHMHELRAKGADALLRPFLEEVRRCDGLLHVSLDVDFLDPKIAPGVGTPVDNGAHFYEASHIMEILHDSKLVTSLDIAELNPRLDARGKTARILVGLIAILFGRCGMMHTTRQRSGAAKE